MAPRPAARVTSPRGRGLIVSPAQRRAVGADAPRADVGGASVDNQDADGRCADWRSTIAITGINRSAFAWAISGGQVQ
jgi:hypothetical protein